MKGKCKLSFYCYLDPDGMQKQILGPKEPDNAEIGSDKPIKQPLTMSGLEKGIYTGKEITGEITLCKDEVKDLLDSEAIGLRALFVLELKDS